MAAAAASLSLPSVILPLSTTANMPMRTVALVFIHTADPALSRVVLVPGGQEMPAASHKRIYASELGIQVETP